MHPSIILRPLVSQHAAYPFKKHLQMVSRPYASSAVPAEVANVELSEDLLQPDVKFSFKQIKALPLEIIRAELKRRSVPVIGRKTQLASRLYSKLLIEGRALSSEESAVGDASLLEEFTEDDEEEEISHEMDPLLPFQNSCTGSFVTGSEEEKLVANAQGLQVFFLDGAPGRRAQNGIRVATSTAVRTQRSLWLFDCGEDTQRAVLGHPLIEWKRMDRIFISSLSPDCILGIPGMLCTIGASRLRGHENADIPIHLYGPQGLVDFIDAMMTVSNTYLEMPVIIHEMIPRALTPEEEQRIQTPVLVNRRSMLYAVAIPPDQLNPVGYYDGELSTMLTRHTQKKQSGGIDERSGLLHMAVPSPGDPSASGKVPVSAMTWTIRADAEFIITAGALRHKAPCFGYLIREAGRAGKMFSEKALALGVQDSEEMAVLKAGTPITTPSGRVVLPQEVVGPPRRGRRMAIVGPCYDSSTFASRLAGEDAFDILVHAISTPHGEALAEGISMGTIAGKSASILKPTELILWQQQTASLLTQEAQDPGYPLQVLEDARHAYETEKDKHVSIAGVFDVHQVDREPALGPLISSA